MGLLVIKKERSDMFEREGGASKEKEAESLQGKWGVLNFFFNCNFSVCKLESFFFLAGKLFFFFLSFDSVLFEGFLEFQTHV